MHFNQKNLEKNIKIASRWMNWAVRPLTIAEETCKIIALHYPVVGVDAILGTAVALLGTLRNLALKRALKNDPSLQGPTATKSYSVYTGLLGLCAIIGISLGAIGVEAAAVPWLSAIGFLFFSGAMLIRLGTAVKSLWHEFKHKKEPKETFRLRIFKKTLTCLEFTMKSAFYLCLSILAVAAVVALFTNPVGLSILAGAIATFTLATAVVTLGIVFLKKIVEWRIHKNLKKITQTKKTKKYSIHLENKTQSLLRHLKPRDSKEVVATEAYRSMLGHPLEAEKRRIHVHSRPIPRSSYEALSIASIKVLEHNQKNNPLYKGVHYKVEASHKTGREILTVSIDKTDKLKQKDEIKRYYNDKKEVEITLNREPSDKAIFILLELNKAFRPLEMDACGDANTTLRLFEAAKLAKVDLVLHPKDRTLLYSIAENPKRKAYFEAIDSWSSEEFHLYVNQKKAMGTWKLGTIPDTVPDRPILHPDL